MRFPLIYECSVTSIFRFDTNYNAKQTIENVQMYQLGMKLANLYKSNLVQSRSYSDRAETVFKFINQTGIIDLDTFKVRPLNIESTLN